MTADYIKSWRDEVTRETHVECRFTFTEDEIVGDDLSPSDRAFLSHFGRPDASLTDRLEALSILVGAKEARVGA